MVFFGNRHVVTMCSIHVLFLTLLLSARISVSCDYNNVCDGTLSRGMHFEFMIIGLCGGSLEMLIVCSMCIDDHMIC